MWSAFLALVFVATISCYTLSKDAALILPSEALIFNTLYRQLPNGDVVSIACNGNTVLNKKTLTCEFVKTANEESSFFIIPTNDCRKFKLCDSFTHFCTKLACPGSTLFNTKTDRCDYPQTANCCEFGALNSSRILQN